MYSLHISFVFYIRENKWRKRGIDIMPIKFVPLFPFKQLNQVSQRLCKAFLIAVHNILIFIIF